MAAGRAGTWRRAGELRLEAVPVAVDHAEAPWRAARGPQGLFVEGVAAAVQEEDAGPAQARGGPKDGSQVARVLDSEAVSVSTTGSKAHRKKIHHLSRINTLCSFAMDSRCQTNISFGNYPGLKKWATAPGHNLPEVEAIFQQQ